MPAKGQPFEPLALRQIVCSTRRPFGKYRRLENLSIFQSAVDDLLLSDGVVGGVRTQMGLEIVSRKLYSLLARFWAARLHRSGQQRRERVIHPLLRWQSVFGSSLSGVSA